MGHPFHYFTPGLSAAQLLPGNVLKKELAPTVHLAHWVDAWKKPGSLSVQDAQIDGLSGAFFTPTVNGQPAAVINYVADEAKQRWYKTPKIWVGWEVGNEPGPECFAKSLQFRGYQLPDSSGAAWNIPVAHSPKGNTTLPNDIEWDLDTGQPVQRPSVHFEEQWKLAGEVFDYWQIATKEDRDPTWIQRAALSILQINYQIGMIEMNAFRAMGAPVLDDIFARDVTWAFIDLDILTQVEDLKKNEIS